MLSHVRSIQLVLAGMVLSVAAIVGQRHLPDRVLDLTLPASYRAVYLIGADPGADTGASPVRWVDYGQLALACRHPAPAGQAHPQCGVAFLPNGAGPTQGVDLRGYQSLVLDLAYRGPADHVRVAIRNFDPRFSRESDANSARIHTINLRTRDLAQQLAVKLDELTVPEWWIGQYKLPRDYNLAKLDNATALAIDIPGAQAGQVHEMQVRRLAFHGERISAEATYLAILCGWMLGAAVTIGSRLAELRRQHRLAQREIAALEARTAQLRSEHEGLRQLAMIDELTGVLNRRGLDDRFAALRGRPGAHALVIVDIDHFKRINDAEGHAAGDVVLQRVAAVLAQNVRANDVLGRWGGEEFIVACLDCPIDDAALVAEKIRQRIEASSFSTRQRVAVTASLGVAAMQGFDDFAEAFARADAAMYRAKSAGRNRIVIDGVASSGRPASLGQAA